VVDTKELAGIEAAAVEVKPNAKVASGDETAAVAEVALAVEVERGPSSLRRSPSSIPGLQSTGMAERRG
jgi:hypothetical protein